MQTIILEGLEHSYSYTHNGREGIFTACSECERGGNGASENKCSAGWLITKWNKLGCWSGQPMTSGKHHE